MPSRADTIMADLITAGYTTGSITDREYARLKAKTATTGSAKSLSELYLLAGEGRGRLSGKGNMTGV